MYIKAYSAELKRKMRLSYRSEEEGSTYAVGVGNIKAKAQLNPKLCISSTIQIKWAFYHFLFLAEWDVRAVHSAALSTIPI